MHNAQTDDAFPSEMLPVVEAIMMVAAEPVSTVDLASHLGMPPDQMEALLHELAADYRGELSGRARGFDLRKVAGGWRIFSAPAFADVVGTYVIEGQTARLSKAALETLAVVAYRQPVTRGLVAAIRGVNCDSVMRTLTARGLIEEVGEDGPGGAILYRTSQYFLERLGLDSLDELPELAPYLPEAEIMGQLEEEMR